MTWRRRHEFWLLTYWTDEAAYRRWHAGHRIGAHAGMPKGLKLVPGSAVKYSPRHAGATITVTVLADPRANELRITVADEGVGIPAEERDRVFGPFERTSTRPTADERSTGLGLSIGRSIVGAHDGRIGFDDRPGGGTTFWGVLPVTTR